MPFIQRDNYSVIKMRVSTDAGRTWPEEEEILQDLQMFVPAFSFDSHAHVYDLILFHLEYIKHKAGWFMHRIKKVTIQMWCRHMQKLFGKAKHVSGLFSFAPILFWKTLAKPMVFC
ncbi:MAG: hypothetical protein NC907_00935 [Candidatus Omnitrophica bacterium]|nr:hypothetical protein [Candidatus Omnitrophota bacterium]